MRIKSISLDFSMPRLLKQGSYFISDTAQECSFMIKAIFIDTLKRPMATRRAIHQDALSVGEKYGRTNRASLYNRIHSGVFTLNRQCEEKKNNMDNQKMNGRTPLAVEERLAGMPLSIAVIPWGILAGSYAIDAGLNQLQAQAMSAIFFAGSAQLVAAGMFKAGIGLELCC